MKAKWFLRSRDVAQKAELESTEELQIGRFWPNPRELFLTWKSCISLWLWILGQDHVK